MSKLIVGLELTVVKDIKESLEIASTVHFEFISIPLFHPRNRRDYSTNIDRNGPSTRSDRLLESNQWMSMVIGCLSKWIDLDNRDDTIRKNSEIVFKQEMNWAIHLGVQVIILPSVKQLHSCNYAHSIQSIISSLESSYQQLWIRIPLVLPMDYHTSTTASTSTTNTVEIEDSWMLWDNLFRLSGCSHKLSIALELDEEIPENFNICMSRWKAEPIHAIILPIRLFLTNKHGFPVLSQVHQSVLSIFFESKLHIILTGKAKHDGTYLPYMEYLRFLKSKDNKSLSFDEKFTEGFKDMLQSPLQPLMDNLESSTYETFERDPVKYSQYQLAIAKALSDLMSTKVSNGNLSMEPVVIFVVGAGRGPLVTCSLAAALSQNVVIQIYAVEKNENAIITLRNRAISESWTNVTIISTDMRKWKTEIKADIIVSELLGSFGCNELSPECLDGVEPYLKPHGIMIPTSYTSYLAPVSASRLWMGARDLSSKTGLDTPFVVKFHRSNILCDEIPIFKFIHPKFNRLDDNTRYCEVSFQSSYETTIHGFQGTFESELYRDILISIRPSTITEGMFSWFPIFFPLSIPIHVLKDDMITMHIWRCMDSRKVWYEWCLIRPIVTSIQNSNGKSYWIGY